MAIYHTATYNKIRDFVDNETEVGFFLKKVFDKLSNFTKEKLD
jgi:hypothetical protein